MTLLELVSSLPEIYRAVLDCRYFKGLSWLEVTDRLGYSTSRGHQLINDSFLQFAEAFADIYDYRALLSPTPNQIKAEKKHEHSIN